MSDHGPQRLYLFPLSYTDVPLPTGGTMSMVNGCYLIVTGSGQHILIDSGWPPEQPIPAGMPPRQQEHSLLSHLATIGLTPGGITTVICSHFDIDHVGTHDLFPHAEFIVQRKQLEVANNGHPRFASGNAHWGNPALRYRVVEGDTVLMLGIHLIETSGHAPGHQSVLVELPQAGPVLLAIDAVMMERQFTTDRRAWSMDDNEEQLRASTQKLLDLVERHGVRLVVFGHDGAQWQQLTTAPAYYG
ncbi:MAG: N-acyl homoserine lactonase family protein [Ktedonobacteraceae bacterium]|nr:N-acyl homoserine lactonase family protein [Ktedonobacteraceae bacterium]MBA3822562.1 N-acyl homoserine lactonase family protein [Ktedonobacterales bacterium]